MFVSQLVSTKSKLSFMNLIKEKKHVVTEKNEFSYRKESKLKARFKLFDYQPFNERISILRFSIWQLLYNLKIAVWHFDGRNQNCTFEQSWDRISRLINFESALMDNSLYQEKKGKNRPVSTCLDCLKLWVFDWRPVGREQTCKFGGFDFLYPKVEKAILGFLGSSAFLRKGFEKTVFKWPNL